MTGTPPVDVVGGWLGAGKTTLLRRFLERGAGGQKVAVVVNELGEIGIDGRVVEGLGFAERLVELTSGCVCCQLDTVHFEIALQELVEEIAPDRVVIETSGVADPGALSLRLSELGHHLGAIVTVVDVANLSAVLAEDVGRAQVAAADFLVLSKLDLVPAGNARSRLAALNERAVTVDAPVGDDTLALLFGGPVPDGERAVSGVAAQAAGLESVSWASAAPLDRGRTLALLGTLPPEVYRAKGVVRYASASVPAVVDVVAGRVTSQWEPGLAGGEGSALVFIGRDAGRWSPDLLPALEDLAGR